MWREIKLIEQEIIKSELDEFEHIKSQKELLSKRIEEINTKIKENLSQRKPNIFMKIFQHRRYKDQQLLSKQTISSLREELESANTELESIIAKIEQLQESLYDDRQQLEIINKATSLDELGYNLKEAMLVLEKHNVPIVLQEADKEIIEAGDLKGTSDIVVIHKTDYIPNNDTIMTSKSVVRYEEEVSLGGQKYTISYSEGRDTVHFCANHEVSGHLGGNWNQKKYAIIIPFEELPKDKIGSACPVDIFIKGNVKLTTRAYILCPRGEGKLIRQNNANINIIEYEGESVLGYAETLISILGYSVKHGNAWSLSDSKSQKQYCDIMEKEGLSMVPHAYTLEGLSEDEDTEMYKFVAILKLIRDEKIIDKLGKKQLMQEMSEQGYFKLLKNSIYMENIETGELEVRLDFLYESLEKEGIVLSDEIKKELEDKDSNFEIETVQNVLIDSILYKTKNKDLKSQIAQPDRQKKISQSKVERVE